jgi:outer membrane receptor protein involved in Fe transport
MHIARCVISAVFAVGTAATAQEAQPAPAAAPVPQPETAATPQIGAEGQPRERKAAGEEILITGSRIRRKDLLTPAPITVINREQVVASGKVTIGDFLQTLPEQGNAINTQVNNGGSGATRVSLRGLGPARTLVLLNGRRFVPGGTGADSSVDLNSIPTAAIERIEVLKDGASAVYGSDAIGGVINIITRKRGATELSGFTGISSHGDGKTYDLNATTGTSIGDTGNFIFSGGFYKQEPVWAGDRSFSAIPLAYDATGSRTLTKAPGPYSQGSTTVPAGTIVLSKCTKTTPVNAPCVGRILANPTNDSRISLLNQLVQQNKTSSIFVRDSSTALGWRAFTNASLPSDGGDGYNFQPQNYLVTPSQRISLYAAGDAHISSLARTYFEASYVNRQSKQLLAAEPLLTDSENVTVSKDNIYNPFGVDLTAVRRRLLEFTNRTFNQDIDTFRVVGGVDGTLPAEMFGPLSGWFWDASLNFGRTEGTQIKQGNLNRAFLAAALGPSFVDASGNKRCGTPAAPIAGCVPLNLFGGAGSITDDQVTPLTFTGALRGTNQMTSVLANFGGELVRLAAERPMALAAGYEYRFLAGENIPDPLTVAGLTTGNKGQITRGTYYVNEGYGELSVPILSNIDYVQDLEATVAGRVFNYSSFGSGGTYKLGTRWRIVRDFTARGTYSTGFRAPAISELYAGLADSFPPVSDPCRGLGVAGGGPPPASCGAAAANGDAQTQLRTQVGGTPTLQPERSRMFTAGVVIEPHWVPNLAITVDYYNIRVYDTITTLGASVILAGCYPGDSTIAPKYCDLISRDPITQRITNIVNRNLNVGNDKTDGLDIAMQYALPTQVGRFTLGFDGTWLHKYDRTLADGTVIHGRGNFDLNGSGTGGVYPTFKFISGITWQFAGLNAGTNTRYYSSFTECGTASGNFAGSGLCYVDSTYKRRVRSYNAWDAFVSYTLTSQVGKTNFGAGVNNLFDRQPSAIYNGFTAASDPTAYDFMGRFVYGRITHTF